MSSLWLQHRAKLVGGWKCTSWTIYSSDTQSKILSKPHGDNPLGRVQISPSGYLSAHLAIPDRMRPLPSGKPWSLAETEELAYVARGLAMYCGYLELFEDADGLFWKTKVEVSNDPSRIGGFEERRVRVLEDGGMELRPVNEIVLRVSSLERDVRDDLDVENDADSSQDGMRGKAVLTWERFDSFDVDSVGSSHSMTSENKL